jgi:hypothetical protein
MPKAAHKGDLICLLHGSKVPCILRRSGVGKERYRIISQCYLKDAGEVRRHGRVLISIHLPSS